MRTSLRTVRLFLVVVLLAVGVVPTLMPRVARAGYVPPVNNRVDLNFNYDWKFIKQDVAGAQAVAFNDSAWTAVSLPHTWNDGDRFREWISTQAKYDSQTDYPNASYAQDPPADPALPKGTYYGIGWYRKHFTIDPAYAGRKVILEFQGIGRCAHFYVNGNDLALQTITLPANPSTPAETIKAGYHENGIGPCGLDITSYLTAPGQDNVIAIWVTNDFNYKTVEFGDSLPYGQPFNLNFGGLNRDVTMHISDLLYQTLPLFRNLGTQGTYVYPSGIDTLKQTASLTVQTEVKNDYAADKTATVDAVIVDAAGNQVGATFSAAQQTVQAGALAVFTAKTSMTGVHFWSTDYPYLYHVYTIVKVGGQVVDVNRTVLGVRKYKFGSTIGLQLNGHPIYLNGYAPRTTMEWADVGIPPDWMVEYDFNLIRQGNGNFVRPMHSAPRKIQVDAADKYGVVLACPATATENDETNELDWQQKLYDMRDVCIYFRNNPSVYFWEGNNGDLSATHMQGMLNVTSTWDSGNVDITTANPNEDGRLIGTRAAGTGSASDGLRQYSSPIESNLPAVNQPIWDAEDARGECPRHVWDEYSPMLNPHWDGVNASTTPVRGTIGDTTHKYLLGGFFYISNPYYQLTAGDGPASTVPTGGSGLNYDAGSGINNYLAEIPNRDSSGNSTGQISNGYYRLQSSEDLMLENTSKYYGRYEKSVFVQPQAVSAASGVTIGAAKIFWADSVTDGRLKAVDVARVSGAVDAVRLPKETFYGLRVAQSSVPDIYIAGHWTYPAGTVKRVYVVSNTTQVKLKSFDTQGNLIKDYGYGSNNFFPSTILPTASDQVNKYVFAFDNVAWQPGSIQAVGYNDGSTVPIIQTALGDDVHPSLKSVGAPVGFRITPITGPQGWFADGSDIAMFDVEVVDAAGDRCPTFEDAVTFSCSDATTGTFLGGYNTGVRYTTNVNHVTSGYKLNIESGINRVFVRSTRTAGAFALHVTGNGLSAGDATINSKVFTLTNGLTTVPPQGYTVALGTEPTPVIEGTAPPAPSNSPQPAPAANLQGLHYSGTNQDKAVLVGNAQPGKQVYVDSTTITLLATLPNYLIGGEYIQPFQSDANGANATDQYQFNISRYSRVYQLVDQKNGRPTDDGDAGYGWTKLADTVTINGRLMDVYRSVLLVPYTPVFLSSNNHENVGGTFDPAGNMYLVFIVSAEEELQAPVPKDTIVASTTQTASTPASNAIDGDATTHWNASSGAFTQTLTLSLPAPVSIGGYEINWQNGDKNYYKYQIDVSPSGADGTWLKSLDQTANVTIGTYEYRVPAPLVQNSTAVQYVRITVTGASGGAWAAINELKVRGVLSSTADTIVPKITSVLTASGKGGYAITPYQIAATNTPTGYAAQGLPTGLILNGVSGIISGTTLQGGTFPVTISAINGAGPGSAVLIFTMTDPPPVPVITSALTYPPAGTTVQAGVAITAANTYQATADYMGFTPSSFKATLPNPSGNGLQFSTSTGKITGTPKYPGTYTIPLQGTNPGGTGLAQNLAYTITPNGTAPVISSASGVTGYLGTAYTASSGLYTVTGSGTPTYFGVSAPSSGTLPAWLNINTSTGVIYGTPDALNNFTVVVTATNAGGSTNANVTINITRNPNAPVITSPTSTTVTGHVGSPFSYTIVATNSPTSYSATPLPANVTLAAGSNVISGTPTAQGTTNVVLKATNASGYDQQSLTVVIGAAVTKPVITSPVNMVGSVGTLFNYQITAANTPTTFSATSLPSWVKNFDPASGLLSGTPNAAGTSSVTISASNDGGTSAVQTLTIAISAAGADINLALNKEVVTLNPAISNNLKEYAVDGVGTTRWESPHDDTEWIYVNLGAVYPIHEVDLNWQGQAVGKNFTIEVSNTGVEGSWTNFVPPIVGNTKTGLLTYPGNANAQYVRMNGTLRASIYGYSLYEFLIMGQPAVVNAPAGPTGLKAVPGTGAGQITLSWSALSGAQAYILQRSTNATTGFVTVGTVSTPALTYTDSDAALAAGLTYYYRIAATTAQGATAYSDPVSGTPYVPPGVAGWRYKYFGAAGNNPTDANGASDASNPAHDGITNLVKYALGLDPTVNYYVSGSAGLPTVGPQSVGTAQYLTLTFRGAATDLIYKVQATDGLGGAWTTLATYSGSSAVGTFTVQDSKPVSASTARFMRLQILEP